MRFQLGSLARLTGLVFILLSVCWPTVTIAQSKKDTTPPQNTGPVSPARPLQRDSIPLKPLSVENLNAGNVFDGFDIGLSGKIPPDPICSAGLSHVLIAGNGRVEWYTKDGIRTHSESLFQFFSPLYVPPAEFDPFDPKTIYDQYNDRFIVIALNGRPESSPQFSEILVAVSSTSDPDDPWYYHSIDSMIEIGGIDTWADFPGLGVGLGAVFVTANQFTFGAAAQLGTRLWIIHKTPFFADGTTPTVTLHDAAGASGANGMLTAQPAHMFGTPPGNVGTFLVRYDNTLGQSQDLLSIIQIDDPLGTPSFTHIEVDPGNIDEDSLPWPPDAPQPGSSTRIDTGFKRILHSVWRDNVLWATGTIVPWEGDDIGEATAHWWKVDTSNSPTLALMDQGNIGGEDISSGAYTYFASVAVDKFGNAAFGFAASSASVYAGAYYAVREAGDPPGTVSASQPLGVGLDYYVKQEVNSPPCAGYGRNRWGDYSGIALDPTDERTFWIFNEYASVRESSPVCSGQDGRWATKWGSFYFNRTVAVPGDELTIQLGIDASLPGDVVQVDGIVDGDPKTYFETLVMSRSVPVLATPGLGTPTIDALGASSAVYFPPESNNITELSGFRITNFSTSGIVTNDATPSTEARVNNCIIEGGMVGVWSLNAKLELLDCTITGQSPGIGAAAGVFLEDYTFSDPSTKLRVENNVISSAAGTQGIHVSVWNREVWIYGNTIDSWATGIVLDATSDNTTLERNIVTNGSVAGIDCDFNTATLFCNDAFGNFVNYKNCGTLDPSNIQEDPLYCEGREGKVEEYTLRIDSPVLEASCGVMGAQGVECAWGTLARSVTIDPDTEVLVLQDLTVPAPLSLTLMPGATLKFDADDNSGGGYYSDKNELSVEGSLVGGVIGQAPVVFTSGVESPAPSAWGLINCSGPATVQLSNAIIEYADIGMNYLAEDVANTLEDVTFQYNGLVDVQATRTFVGGQFYNPGGTFLNCTFNVNGVYGARMQFKTNNMTFQGCTFIGGPVPLAGMAWLYSGGVIDGGEVRDFSNGAGILTTKELTSSPVTPTIRNVQVSGNEYGMEWRNDSGGLAEDCTFAPGSGQPTDMWIRDTAAPTIRSNTFEENSGNTGIRVDDDAAPDLGPNNILEARKFGISTHWNSAPEIHDNQISDCYNGILTEWASAPRVRGNQIDNCRYGVKSASTATPDLGTFPDDGNNSITSSQTKLVDGGNGRVFPLMAENNWWGSDPPVPGKFTANVDYTPWLSGPPSSPGLLNFSNGNDVQFISGVFPNPTSSGTRFVFQVPRTAQGELEIFDVSGRLVQVMPLGEVQEGALEARWNGADARGNQVATGVYLYRLRVGAFEKRGRLIVVR